MQPLKIFTHNSPPRTRRCCYWFLVIIDFGTSGLRTEFIKPNTTRLEYLGARRLPFKTIHQSIMCTPADRFWLGTRLAADAGMVVFPQYTITHCSCPGQQSRMLRFNTLEPSDQGSRGLTHWLPFYDLPIPGHHQYLSHQVALAGPSERQPRISD